MVYTADEDIFLKNASSVAEKKLNTIKINNAGKEKIRQKLFAYLLQKGYEAETIYQVLNNMNF